MTDDLMLKTKITRSQGWILLRF